MSRLEWHGPAVREKVMQAAEAALTDTVKEAAQGASAETWRSGIQYRSPEWGAAADTIRFDLPQRDGSTVRVRWGSTLWRYIFIEKGVAHMAGGHFLTRSADAHYPKLGERIRQHYDR